MALTIKKTSQIYIVEEYRMYTDCTRITLKKNHKYLILLIYTTDHLCLLSCLLFNLIGQYILCLVLPVAVYILEQSNFIFVCCIFHYYLFVCLVPNVLCVWGFSILHDFPFGVLKRLLTLHLCIIL